MQKDANKMMAKDIQLQDVSDVIPSKDSVVFDPALLNGVMLDVSVCIGTLKISVGELSSLKANQSFSLGIPVDQEVLLKVNDRVIAKGDLVVVGDCFGIRLSELVRLHKV